MKPKNKFHKDILRQSRKLRPVTKMQREWAISECFEHFAFRLQNGNTTCMDCGHTWKTDGNTDKSVCPVCGRNLTVKTTRKQKESGKMYFNVLGMHGEYQTLRMFAIFADMCKGRKAEYTIMEIGQYWIAPNGQCAVIGLRRSMSFYYDCFSFDSGMEIRGNDDVFAGISSDFPTYPKIKIIPSLHVDVVGNKFFKMSPARCISRFLSLPQLETIMKNGDEKVFSHFLNNPNECRMCWASYKIAKRHHYEIKSIGVWCDYIKMLKTFKKDVRNPHYICPDNLHQAHDTYVKKVRAMEERKRREADIKRKEREALKEQKDREKFIKLKSKFFGLVISDGEIEVKVLESVEEYIEEGNAQNICVGTLRYYAKSNTLVLSARIDGNRIETVEVSLDTFEVVQCHGKYNKDTEYHKRIIDLVNSNARLIKERMTA
ncbi:MULTISPECIES: PcfJ domain-containing protein [Bacteroidales]|uniref:PcfJ domain-containing protein n=1 Tax=Bacteroidales TaxID=171549 RepID=UPI0025777DFE|nr:MULTISPECIES: PcfJ domain-containing protein [Bacteroidales]